MSRRGTTRAGQPARMPDGAYNPPPPVHRSDAGGLIVDFHGEDGRSQAFQLPQLPLPGWHRVLAEALAVRLGPGGARRTLSSARSEWQVVRRFLRILTQLPKPPSTPDQLQTTTWKRGTGTG